jgi:hypothetical protein
MVEHKNFPPSSFGVVVGSGIRDVQKSGSRIRDKHPGSATLVIMQPVVIPHVIALKLEQCFTEILL